MLGCISKRLASRLKKVFFPLHNTWKATSEAGCHVEVSSAEGHRNRHGAGALAVQRGRGSEVCSVQISWQVVICKTEPHPLQCCIAKGQGAMVTQWEILTRYREKKTTVRMVKQWKHIGPDFRSLGWLSSYCCFEYEIGPGDLQRSTNINYSIVCDFKLLPEIKK